MVKYVDVKDEVNGCMVGRTKQRGMWAWLCPDCGKGGLIPTGERDARQKARNHALVIVTDGTIPGEIEEMNPVVIDPEDWPIMRIRLPPEGLRLVAAGGKAITAMLDPISLPRFSEVKGLWVEVNKATHRKAVCYVADKEMSVHDIVLIKRWCR